MRNSYCNSYSSRSSYFYFICRIYYVNQFGSEIFPAPPVNAAVVSAINDCEAISEYRLHNTFF